MASFRKTRLGDQIHHALARSLSKEVNDQRLKNVTITFVDVAPNLSHAKVFFISDNETDKKELLKAFKNASGFLRRELATNLDLRATPRLMFFYDDAVERGARISKLLDE